MRARCVQCPPDNIALRNTHIPAIAVCPYAWSPKPTTKTARKIVAIDANGQPPRCVRNGAWIKRDRVSMALCVKRLLYPRRTRAFVANTTGDLFLHLPPLLLRRLGINSKDLEHDVQFRVRDLQPDRIPRINLDPAH